MPIPTALDAEMMVGGFGKYLAYHGGIDQVAVRVLSCQDPEGDVFAESKRCTLDWRVTADLIRMAWENAVEVLYGVTDHDRDVAWDVARSMDGYSGITHDFYKDGEGWTVVVVRALATA